MENVKYQGGLFNHFETEALEGALPRGQNSPQKPPLGLYSEQISGSSFTAPRARNFKSWLYRIKPSVVQGDFTQVGHATWLSTPAPTQVVRTPQALRFHPYPETQNNQDFLDSIFTYAINGSPETLSGCAIHLFSCNQSMKDRFLYNADGEMMIVPEKGELILETEMGILELAPQSIGVIPRGIKFKVSLKSKSARGYICENFGQPFQLPELGPIGANGLANPRDFEIPTACYEDQSGNFECFARYQGSLWQTTLPHSPLNVVAWHGNYAPYRYDLLKFNTINTVSFDHPDPSIFTVLTSPSAIPGTANLDFVIFPPRWMVAENTFRPPYFHRNIMNEFMGLIYGQYDAKPEGFKPGGASIHNCMTGHGPDETAFESASNATLTPQRLENTLAFMWESCYPFFPTHQVLKHPKLLDQSYIQAWQKLPKKFNAPKK